MNDLIKAMERITNATVATQKALQSMAFPPDERDLEKAFNASQKARSTIGVNWKVSENRYRVTKTTYDNSDELTLGVAVKAIRTLEETGRHLITDEPSRITLSPRQKIFLGSMPRPVRYSTSTSQTRNIITAFGSS